MKDNIIEDLLENYMECGYDKITIYCVDGTYHTFELYNTKHRYTIKDGLLRVTKCPQRFNDKYDIKQQEVTFIIDKIEKIIAKE